MAINYKNILLKDNLGNPLLPITLSYYVEYKDGVDVRTYLDTLSTGLDSVNVRVDNISETQQSLITGVNNALDYFSSYIERPDHTDNIVFNTAYPGLSSTLSGLEPDAESYVTAQQALAALDSRLDSAYTYLETVEGRVTTVEGKVSTLETSSSSFESRLSTAEGTITQHGTDISGLRTDVNNITDLITNEDDRLSIPASAVTFDGTNTTELTNSTTVQNALVDLDTKIHSLDTSISGVISQAGVTYVSAAGGGIKVTGTGDGALKQGSVSVALELSNDGKLKLDSTNKLTVDESKFDLTNTSIPAANIEGKIQTSQIEGGLDADNINITYSYTEGDVVHNDGEKSLQEFYTEYVNKIEELEAASYTETLDNRYNIGVTSNTDSSYARVYTITQGSETYTINIPKDQFLNAVYYVNSTDDMATTLPEGMTLTVAEQEKLPALVFVWQITDSDIDNAKTYSVVSIKDLLETLSGEIATEVSALSDRVDGLEDRVDAIEGAGYITGVTLDDRTFTPDSNGVVNLTSTLQYDPGKSTDAVTPSFLQMHGIPTPQDNSQSGD